MTERGRLFIEELQRLLRKYSAEISASDHWRGYAECGEDVRMTVEFSGAPYDEEDIDLGGYIDGDKEM